MFIVIAYMLAGIFIGYSLRNKRIKFINKSIITLIWLLLFLLGIEVGANETVVQQFGKLGFEAFLLAAGATIGSLVAAWLLWTTLHPKNAGK